MTELEDGPDYLRAGAAQLGLALSSQQLAQFAAYADLLHTWNARFNLLGPAAARTLWSKHFLDALTIMPALPTTLTQQRRLEAIDLGSGAGLPGIPLAIAFPSWQVTLLEVTAKKVRFLELVGRELAPLALAVLAGRAEELAHRREYRERFDLCVARAVTATPALVELTLPFVRPGGSAILYKGTNGLAEELRAAEAARAIVGGDTPIVLPIGDGLSEARSLVRYPKVGWAHWALPRRPGLPEHQPLTAEAVACLKAPR